jgi:predicted RNA-binding Zn-ribbon protein involved in translation (DUF1610 family)
MALCFACHQEIGYLAMICGSWHHLKRNFIRKNLVVFDCPHCGALCQEKAWSYYGYLLIFVAAILLFVQMRWIDLGTMSDWRYTTTTLTCYFVGSIVWWKFVTQLKEPHVFGWE